MSQNPDAVRYAIAGLRGDKVIVLAAVRQSGWALEYASEVLRGDSDVLAAASGYGARRCASLSLHP